MALAAAYAINRVLPNGDAVAFFRIRSRARHETRSAALFRTAVSRNFGKHSDETPSHGQKKRVRLHTPDSLFLRLTEIPFTPPGRRGR